MTRYSSEEAYQAALNNPNSFENTMMGGASDSGRRFGVSSGSVFNNPDRINATIANSVRGGSPSLPDLFGGAYENLSGLFSERGSTKNPFGLETEIRFGEASPSIGGIQYYLNPFLQKLADQQRNQAMTNITKEFDNKAEPYMEEVKQLTEDTFPNYTGGVGMGFGGGFMPQGKIEEPFQQFQGVGIGSLFGSSNNFNPFRS